MAKPQRVKIKLIQSGKLPDTVTPPVTPYEVELPVKQPKRNPSGGTAYLGNTPSKAREVMTERLTAQSHDPAVTLLPGGGYGKVIQTPDGRFTVERVEAPKMEYDELLEVAVNEVTRQELTLTTAVILKKVAMAPSVVMGHAYLVSTMGDDGRPLYEGDIGDFLNFCVRRTLKYGFGVEMAIATGGPTTHKVLQMEEENN